MLQIRSTLPVGRAGELFAFVAHKERLTSGKLLIGAGRGMHMTNAALLPIQLTVDWELTW